MPDIECMHCFCWSVIFSSLLGEVISHLAAASLWVSQGTKRSKLARGLEDVFSLVKACYKTSALLRVDY